MWTYQKNCGKQNKSFCMIFTNPSERKMITTIRIDFKKAIKRAESGASCPRFWEQENNYALFGDKR
ncbi:MAG: hypothetical protein WBZ33_15715, partial [Thermoactinomyces sp.]